jgi:hypothetical protein
VQLHWEDDASPRLTATAANRNVQLTWHYEVVVAMLSICHCVSHLLGCRLLATLTGDVILALCKDSLAQTQYCATYMEQDKIYILEKKKIKMG